MPSLARLLLPLVLVAAACADRPDGPNILLITLDTTRRDHLGFYGYGVPTSPNLDRLAAESLVYTNAYAVSSWTMPTHASMFTGKFPSAHGAIYDPEGPLTLSEGIEGNYGAYRARPIAEKEVTLAMLLTEHGYTTGGVVAGPWMKKVFHLNRGFEHYDDDNVTALNGRPAENVTDAAIAFVDEHADEPFFLFLNYYDAHSPWVDESRKPFHDVAPVWPRNVDPTKLGQAEQNAIVYDAEVRYMDKHIGRLLDHLRTEGLFDGTWIFVLSDHGELIGDPVLGDVGLWGHGDSLTQPEIHIPFLVKEPGPGGRTGKDESFVQQVDLLPTIVQRLGIPLPPNVQGMPLGSASHPIVAELVKLPMMNRTVGPGAKDWRHLGNWNVLVEGTAKYGWSSNGTNFLIDLARDPDERLNLAGKDAARESALRERLDGFLRSLPRPGAVGEVQAIDAETQKALESLGYTGRDPEGEAVPDAEIAPPGESTPH
jgi:arylsulfatase A-like enzyme